MPCARRRPPQLKATVDQNASGNIDRQVSIVAGVAITDSSSSSALESTYVVGGGISPEVMASSLQALLAARHHPIARHRFTVLDTFDGRVRHAGARLTRSGINGRSVVVWQPRGRGGHLTVRLKEPVSFAWDLPEGPLRDAVARVAGVRRLLAQVEREQIGSLLEILDVRGKTVARLQIESGQVRLPMAQGSWKTLPTIITLTGLRGYEEVYERLLPLIESRPGIEPCPEGLHGLTLRQLGVPERDHVSLRHLGLAPSIRADIGARQIHRALLRVLVENEPGLRASLDTEFLHDFRVAVRRTRALLGQIRDVFPPEAVEHFSTEFSWIGRLTGPSRDLDVLVLALRKDRGDIPAGDMDAVRAFLRHAQEKEQRALVEALDSGRYRRLLSEWESFLDRSVSYEPEPLNAGRLLREVVSPRAWRLSRRIAGSAETIDERTEPARIHDVRIAAKKLRYLVDVTPAFYAAADLERIVGALKSLQRVLGDFHDAHLQQQRLLECRRVLGATGGAAGAVLAFERLAEQRRERRERLRAQVVDGLARFRARDTRSACRRAFKAVREPERSL
jgi:CHAD domain-containing protein